MHILQSLLKSKIFTLKNPKDSRFIFLVLNAVFINALHVKAVQDDIYAITVPIWLRHTVWSSFSLAGHELNFMEYVSHSPTRVANWELYNKNQIPILRWKKIKLQRWKKKGKSLRFKKVFFFLFLRQTLILATK